MFKSRIIFITSFVLLTSILFSCQKEENARNYFWDQTLCADPWGVDHGAADDWIIGNVRTYLKHEKKIRAFHVEVDHTLDYAMVCEACNCSTGTRIIVLVDERMETDLLELGFKKL